jgi:hypothetical protein
MSWRVCNSSKITDKSKNMSEKLVWEGIYNGFKFSCLGGIE